MKKILVWLALIFGCAGPATISSTQQGITSCAQIVPQDCTVGATANDGLDDRAAIQAACAQQHCAYLPAGTYDIDTPAPPPGGRRIYAMIDATACQIFGDGASTVLNFRGDLALQDWEGILLAGNSPSVHDLAINTANIENTTEQTHAIRELGPTTGAQIYHVTFNHPQRGEIGGDCVQHVCYAPDKLCTNSTIYWNKFLACDRSGVACHSGCEGLQITDNEFYNTGDQDIDGEGSGDNRGWLIARNVFNTDGATVGTAVQLQGLDTAHIVSNSFNGRGLFLYSASNVELDHNAVIQTVPTAVAVIDISKTSNHTNIHDNIIIRAASAGNGQVIHAGPHSSGTPTDVTVQSNLLVQNTAGDVFNASGLVGLNFNGNTVTYNGGAGFNVVQSNGSIAVRSSDIHVNNNQISGAPIAVLGIAGSYAGVGTFQAVGNSAPGASYGIRCQNIATGGQIIGPADVHDNIWHPSICGSLVVAPQ